MSVGYESVANTLKDRIVALIPDHPEILTMKDAGDLFQIEGFECGDLEPSFYQASWALSHAQDEWEQS